MFSNNKMYTERSCGSRLGSWSRCQTNESSGYRSRIHVRCYQLDLYVNVSYLLGHMKTNWGQQLAFIQPSSSTYGSYKMMRPRFSLVLILGHWRTTRRFDQLWRRRRSKQSLDLEYIWYRRPIVVFKIWSICFEDTATNASQDRFHRRWSIKPIYRVKSLH
jgi:hypothetical protein